MLALAWQRRPRLQSDEKQQALVLWGMWLLTTGIFFSVASALTHSYYTATMAPALAALFGIGLVTMWQDYRRGGWRGWLLPLALLLTAAEQVYLLMSYPTWGQWMIPLLTIPCVLAVGALLAARFPRLLRLEAFKTRLLLSALGIGVLALMVAPTVWATIPVLQGTQADILQAGPQEGNVGVGGLVLFTGSTMTAPQLSDMVSPPTTTVDPALLRYLEANQGKTTFLVATDVISDQLILDTNKPVITLSGFSGHDLTGDQITTMVAQNTVRLFLLSPSVGNQSHQVILGGGPGQDNATTTWVRQHCQEVPAALWQAAATRSTPGSGNQLYDCATIH
jgi:4-amino-4-deoxy-L-arabinose transferase-like glycosyltransferase